MLMTALQWSSLPATSFMLLHAKHKQISQRWAKSDNKEENLSIASIIKFHLIPFEIEFFVVVTISFHIFFASLRFCLFPRNDSITQQLFLQLQSAFIIYFIYFIWINSHCSDSLNLNKFLNDSPRRFSICHVRRSQLNSTLEDSFDMHGSALPASSPRLLICYRRAGWGWRKARLLIFSPATTFNKDIIFFCAFFRSLGRILSAGEAIYLKWKFY